jgi:hypothetical protein
MRRDRPANQLSGPGYAWVKENKAAISRNNLAFAAATGCAVILLFTLGLSMPQLLVEDGPVENLSAAGFFIAAVVAPGIFMRGNIRLAPAERTVLFAAGILSLLLFLSEISFGARLLHIRMPKMKGGGEFDGGHDIVILVFRAIRDAGSGIIFAALIVTTVFLALALVLLLRFRRQAWSLARYVLSRRFEFRLLLAICMIASAIILDLIQSYKAEKLEECLEFCASGVLIAACAGLLRKGGTIVRRATRISIPPHAPRQF